MNFVAIPKNASMSVCDALEITHRHARASEVDGPRWAIVRNPFDRALSAYSFAATSHYRKAREFLGDATTLAEFLRLPDNTLTRSQSWWLDAPVDLVLKLEDLPGAFDAQFGMKLPVVNDTHHIAEHDAETRALVLTRYTEDFERFGYVTST